MYNFDEMKYNPVLNLDMPFILVYPKLARYTVLTVRPEIEVKKAGNSPRKSFSNADFDKVVRYTLMFCVRDGNPIADISNWNERAAICKESLGIDKKENEMAAHVIDTDHIIIDQLMRFWLQLTADDMYEMWITLRTQFHNYNKFLRTPAGEMDETSGTKIKEMTKMLPELQKSIDRLEAAIFIDNKVRSKIIEEETQFFYAEKYAKEW